MGAREKEVRALTLALTLVRPGLRFLLLLLLLLLLKLRQRHCQGLLTIDVFNLSPPTTRHFEFNAGTLMAL